MSRKLSLELGLRYNIIQPLYSALGNFSTFDPARFDPALAPPRVAAGDGSLAPGTGNATNGIVIFGDGFPEAAQGRIPAADNAAARALFAGVPRGGYETSHGDIGPHLGFSYDPFRRGQTAIRGGFGIFYDRIRTDYLGNTAANPPFILSANIFDGNIDDPRGGATRSFPPNLTAIRSEMPTPKVISMNVGVQQELPASIILHVNYVGTRGRNLTRTVNINQLRPGTRLSAPGSTTNVNALRPYLGYANINLQENKDRSTYNSLQVSALRKMTHGLEFGVNYTWSRATDTSSDTPQDVYDISERTPSRWFNTEAFLAPERITPGQFGTSGRNILIGPSFRQWDVALSKTLGLGGRVDLQLRAEAFNVFNQVSFTNLNTVVRFDNSRRNTGGYGAVTAAAPGRTLEFGARVTF